MQQREQVRLSWVLAVFVGGFFGGVMRYGLSFSYDGRSNHGGYDNCELIGQFSAGVYQLWARHEI